ncbi:hypothetical protein ACIA8F_12815 [Streptomyces sp. NPDC051563]|uniref:hypothetical protein n=1 Tax=Streptomyces sp. NPDC051563 TaxID=3365659 RepID=UPI0037A70580
MLPAAANTPPAKASSPAQHGFVHSTAAAARGAVGVRAPLPLFEAIDRLPVAAEHREGYERGLYMHWNKGLNSGDGCNTRREVFLAEVVTVPQVEAGCKLTGGYWSFAYDNGRLRHRRSTASPGGARTRRAPRSAAADR